MTRGHFIYLQSDYILTGDIPLIHFLLLFQVVRHYKRYAAIVEDLREAYAPSTFY